MNKKDLLDKIKDLQGLTKDEKAYLVNLVNTKKKYGLVWEDKIEDVEEQLRTQLPVLKEVKERALISDDPDAPNHILIEGDNLHALTALTFTHEEKIDLIYIDPPYNTGKEDEFKYNDKWIDKESPFRHSMWLSFMNKRLKIAKRLLAEDGVIVISIDHNEVAQLKMLCDEIFDWSSNPKNSNNLGLLVWDLGTGTQAGHFTRANEYLLVYAKSKQKVPNFKGGKGIIDDRAQKKIGKKNPASEFNFPKGTKFEAPEGFELSGTWGGKEKSTLVSGRMICEDGELKEDIVIRAGWTQRNQMIDFFDGKDTIDSKGQHIIEFYFRKNGKIYSRKKREILNPPTVLRDVATTKQGSSLLKSMFNGEEPIKFIKPVQLISWFLKLMPEKKTILDFFAGSATTLHSIMLQNKKDGHKRVGIIATNNENKIAEEVAYVRSKKAIKGYVNDKGKDIEGLTKNNLRYYKTDFVSRKVSLANKRKLTRLATELLCIKEDCYTEVTSDVKVAEWNKLFTNAKGDYVYIIYDDLYVEDAVEALEAFIKEKNTKTQIKVYVFANGQYAYAEEFEDVAENIRLAALPDAIYKAYQNILPNEEREEIPELEEEPEELNESGQTQMNL